MRKLFAFIVIAAAFTGSVQAQHKYYDEQLDGMKQIRQATETAQATDRYILCQVGGNWCPWCIRFADFATTDSVIAPLLDKNFVYVHINYSKANKNTETMKYLGNPARFGFPVFVVLDTDGRPIHIQESASLEEGKSYDRKKVERFLKGWTREAVTTLK